VDSAHTFFETVCALLLVTSTMCTAVSDFHYVHFAAKAKHALKTLKDALYAFHMSLVFAAYIHKIL
jgi:hypothetical protein